jgi:glycosyltransferase involved in cell wall biosynthesis
VRDDTPQRGKEPRPIRALHSFPHKIGAGRICDTAWYEVATAAKAGAEVVVHPGVVHRPLPPTVAVRPTLARGRLRIPYTLLGLKRALRLHDQIVARRLEQLADRVDVVHAWPLAAAETLSVARRLGVTTVLERPNAHTRYALEAVREESERIGVELPKDYEHAYDEDVLQHEELEYELADFLLCASEFARVSFLERGFPPEKLLRHTYGYDPRIFHAGGHRERDGGLIVLFAGVAAVRKGLHFALEAWLRSPASENGTFLIAGEFLLAYERHLDAQLSHPSVHVLGHRSDVPELMRTSDVLVLPTIEEGFGIVCIEALASGAVPLVSKACTDACEHGVNSLVHEIGDVDALTTHLTALHRDRELLASLREGALRTAPQHTWDRAGEVLVDAYAQALDGRENRRDAVQPARLPERAAR